MRQQPRMVVPPFVLGLLATAALAHGEDALADLCRQHQKCKAHLAVSAELYAKGNRAAALHASHPIQESATR